MDKHLHRGDRTVDEDQRIGSDFATERDDDITLVIRFEFPSAEKCFGGWDMSAFRVMNAKRVSRVGHALHGVQVPFVD